MFSVHSITYSVRAVFRLGKYRDSHDPGGGQHGGEHDRDRAGGQCQVGGGRSQVQESLRLGPGDVRAAEDDIKK